MGFFWAKMALLIAEVADACIRASYLGAFTCCNSEFQPPAEGEMEYFNFLAHFLEAGTTREETKLADLIDWYLK